MREDGSNPKDDSLFFEVKTIGLSKYGGRKPQSLLDSARHNRRKIQAELGARSHIAPERIQLNQTIAGPSTHEEVVDLAAALMASADTDVKKLRKDYTQAYELLFSLPAGTGIDTDVFFRHCLCWAEEQFGQAVILSADIHRDESTPHLHVLLVPIANGKYVGSKLITRQELSGLRESFAKLALSYGLREPVRRLHGAAREDAVQAVLAHLEAIRDPLLQSALWFMVKSDITRGPARYAAKLGIVLAEKKAPAKKLKSMAEVFTGKGKGPKAERRVKPIGFEQQVFDDTSKPIGFDQATFDDPQKPIGFENDGVKTQEKIETIALLVSPKRQRHFSPVEPPAPAEIEALTKPDLVATKAPTQAPATKRTVPKLVRTTSKPSAYRPDSPATMDDPFDTVTRERDGSHEAGAWDSDLGEFVVIQTTRETTTRPDHKAPGDTHVERDDYQPEFSESEEFQWQD